MKKLFAAILLLSGISFWACQKEYSYETTTDTASTGAWEFKDSVGTTYAGDAQAYSVDTTNAVALMDYSGVNTSQQALFSISIDFPTRRAATGTYTSAAGNVDFTYTRASKTLYRAEAGNILSGANITVIISQITDTSVTGTFSGTAIDTANKVKIIKEGKFAYKKRSASTTPTGPASTGSLGTSTDTSCTGAVVSGTYKKGTAVANTNTVTITANVTAVGTYTIYSDTLKGIYFRNTGTFATTGALSVVIPAIGTPTDTGTVRFHIRYGTSSCTFRVKIDTASITSGGGTVTVIPPTGDYFPITTNSNWSYTTYDSGTTTVNDTAYTLSTGTTSTIGGNTYNWFLSDHGGSYDTSYYSKGSGLYYTAADVSDGTGAANIVKVNFLKDNVAVGATWTENFTTTFSGSPATARFTNVILAKSVAVTAGNVSSTDVIKVGTTASLLIFGVAVPGFGGYVESWYARGGGLIYSLQRDISGTTPTQETKLRRLYIAP